MQEKLLTFLPYIEKLPTQIVCSHLVATGPLVHWISECPKLTYKDLTLLDLQMNMSGAQMFLHVSSFYFQKCKIMCRLN